MVLQNNMKHEEAAREDIDNMLELSGWKIQDCRFLRKPFQAFENLFHFRVKTNVVVFAIKIM
jgi:hypothetical protein